MTNITQPYRAEQSVPPHLDALDRRAVLSRLSVAARAGLAHRPRPRAPFDGIPAGVPAALLRRLPCVHQRLVAEHSRADRRGVPRACPVAGFLPSDDPRLGIPGGCTDGRGGASLGAVGRRAVDGGGCGSGAGGVAAVTIREDRTFPECWPHSGRAWRRVPASPDPPHGPSVTRLLSTRPMVWLGDRSQLCSWLLAGSAAGARRVSEPGAVTAAAARAASIRLSYRFVEQPIRLGRRLASPRATVWMAIACVAVPLACGAALVAASGRSWGRPDLAALRAVILPPHIDVSTRCVSTVPLGSPGRPACTWPVTTAARRGTILLIGDSHAGHFSEPLIAAANQLGYDAQIATNGGCPLIVRSLDDVRFCSQFVEGSLAAIARRRPAYRLSSSPMRRRTTSTDPWDQRSRVCRGARDPAGCVGSARPGSAVDREDEPRR